jgi:hypothetical protein
VVAFSMLATLIHKLFNNWMDEQDSEADQEDNEDAKLNPSEGGADNASEDAPRALVPMIKWWDQYLYAAFAGVMGGVSVFLAGTVAKIISVVMQNAGTFVEADKTPWSYYFIAGAACTLVAQTYLLNCAMMLGDNVAVIPMFQFFWLLFSVSDGECVPLVVSPCRVT